LVLQHQSVTDASSFPEAQNVCFLSFATVDRDRSSLQTLWAI